MDPARYMLLLNPASPGWQQAATGTHHQGLRWQDVAHALGAGGLPALAHTLGRARYCEDPACARQLHRQVQRLVTATALRQKWRCRSDIPARLARLATHEALDDARCSRCEGRGINRRLQPCRHCHGSGREALKAAQRYHFAGIDKRNWERRWQGRYETIYRQLCEAEQQLLGHLARQLHG